MASPDTGLELSPHQGLFSLLQGLSLSGCEVQETNEAFRQGLLENHPTMTESCFVCSDTVGTIATAFEDGGWNGMSTLRTDVRRGGGGHGVAARAR